MSVASWQTDSDNAAEQAELWFEQVASANEWSDAWREYFREQVLDPVAPGWSDFGWWESSAIDYWSMLVAGMWDAEESLDVVPVGWFDLDELYQSALAASMSADDVGVDLADVGQALQDTAEDAADVIDPTTGFDWRKAVVGVGLAYVGVKVLQASASRRRSWA